MENIDKPKISIVTVTYNDAEQLKGTIESIAKQKYSNIEYIIVDGNSRDHTRDVIEDNRKYISQYISEHDEGIYDAMNKGLAKATGDYIQFLNAGDAFIDENSIIDIIECAKMPYDIIYGDIMLGNEHKNGCHHHKAKEFTLNNLIQYGTGVLCHQAMLVNRRIAPTYNCKYKYKAELNWYFDIWQSKTNITYLHHKRPFVYYYLGGLGYQNFITNRLEWYRILYTRYGLNSIVNKKFLKFIYSDFSNRYSILKKINKKILK